MLLAGLFIITLLFYTALRMLFMLWNVELFHEAQFSELTYAFLLGLRFDVWAVTILSIPAFGARVVAWVFNKRAIKTTIVLFLIFQSVFFIMNLFDVEFINFMGRRFMSSSMAVAAEIQGKFWATVLVYKILLIISTLLYAAYVFSVIFWTRWLNKTARRPMSRRRQAVLAIAMLPVLVLCIRGGFQRKPLNIAHAQVFTHAALSNLALNSTFTFIKTLNQQPLKKEHFMSQQEMLELVNGAHAENCQADLPQFEKPQNVVLLILESFSLEFMGKVHGDNGFTPFLDEIAQKSLFFPNAYANAMRSIEGIGALLGSMPALMNDPFLKSQFVGNHFYGWGTVLDPNEYGSTFYHGGANGTMYFDQFTRKAGFHRYYGQTEYGNDEDFDGTWGIWDEPFLLKALQDISFQKRPFSAAIFTLTSHNPFALPPKYKDQFPKDHQPIHKVIRYTDEVLRKFFAAAEKQPWYNDTLFVISADHTHLGDQQRPRYRYDLGRYRIPILFFHPRIKKWPQIDLQEPVQQIDVLPSVLDFLHKTPKHKNKLARSVFCKGSRQAVMFLDNSYWLVTRDHVLHADPRGNFTLSPLVNTFVPDGQPTEFFAKPLPADQEAALKENLIRRLQATRQYFSEGLWNNQMYF